MQGETLYRIVKGYATVPFTAEEKKAAKADVPVIHDSHPLVETEPGKYKIDTDPAKARKTKLMNVVNEGTADERVWTRVENTRGRVIAEEARSPKKILFSISNGKGHDTDIDDPTIREHQLYHFDGDRSNLIKQSPQERSKLRLG